MPQAIAAVVSYGIGSAFGVSALSGSVAATIGSIVGYTAVVGGSVAYTSFQSRKLKKSLAGAGAIDQGRTVMARDPLAPRFHVYGEVPVSGPIVFMETSGTKGEYLHLIVVLGDGPYKALGDVRFGDTVVPLDGNGEATGTYAGHVRIKKFLGALAGERDLDLESELPGIWTEHHLGCGVARLHVRLKHNPELFPDGIPAITCMAKGVLVYDERTETTDWTDNAALCTSHWLTFEKYGKGIAYSRLIEADLIEAANICDEEVELADESTERRYTCNGVAYAGDPDGTLADLLAAMAGHVCDAGGRWIIRAGAWRAPSLTLTQSDLVSPLSVVPRQSRQDTFNGVRGTYISPVNQWVPSDFPPVPNDTYMEWDGGKRLWKDVAYNFVTSPATAQRLAKIELERGRQQASFSGTYMLKAMQCQPGDVIGKTWTPLGWAAKSFEVINWSFALIPGDEDSGPTLGVAITARETAEGVWDWNDGEETEVDLAPNTNLRDPRSVPALSNLALTSDGTTTDIQEDGSVLARIKVEWDEPADALTLLGGLTRIQYKLHADSDYTELGTVKGDQLFAFISGPVIGEQYDVRARHENGLGVPGAWSDPETITAAGDTDAPAQVSGLTATAGAGFVSLAWTANTEIDISEYAVHRNTVNNFGTSSVIGEVSANKFIDADGLSAGVTYYYWIVAYDRSENPATQSSVASATPTAPISGAAPSTPSAPTFNAEGTYFSGDGTAYAYVVVNLPALPAGAVAIDILYRVNGSSSWIIADQRGTGSGTARIDDLGPGVAYQFAVRGVSNGGALSTVSSTLNRTTPNAGAPSAPTGLSVSTSSGDMGKVPPVFSAAGPKYTAALAKWTPSTSPHEYQEIASWGALTTVFARVPAGVGEWPIYSPNNWTSGTDGIRVRAIGKGTGTPSAWADLALATGTSSYGTEDMAEQAHDGVEVSSIATGAAAASSVRPVLARYPVNGTYTTVGSGTSEKFNVSLANRGFSTKPDVCSGCIAGMTGAGWGYDYDDPNSTSTNAVIVIFSLDGVSTVGPGNAYRYTFEFIEY